MARALFEPIVGRKSWAWLMAGEPTTSGIVSRWFVNVVAAVERAAGEAVGEASGAVAAGQSGQSMWVEAISAVMPEVLRQAWQAAMAPVESRLPGAGQPHRPTAASTGCPVPGAGR
jgi:hypothetical protein